MANYLITGYKDDIFAPPELARILQGRTPEYVYEVVKRLVRKDCLKLVIREGIDRTCGITDAGYEMIARLENEYLKNEKYADIAKKLRLLSKTVNYTRFSVSNDKKISETWPDGNCPVCQSREWLVRSVQNA